MCSISTVNPANHRFARLNFNPYFCIGLSSYCRIDIRHDFVIRMTELEIDCILTLNGEDRTGRELDFLPVPFIHQTEHGFLTGFLARSQHPYTHYQSYYLSHTSIIYHLSTIISTGIPPTVHHCSHPMPTFYPLVHPPKCH